jgi:hypothetical protein
MGMVQPERMSPASIARAVVIFPEKSWFFIMGPLPF